MGFRMKNFDIIGVPWEIWFLRGSHEKPICLKRGTWTVGRFKKELGKKEGFGVFEGCLIPQCTLWWQKCFVNFPKNALWNILFKNLLIKFCKSIFYVSAVNYYCTYIFKGSNYIFSGFLFRIYFKNSYFDASISNYL